MPTVRDLPRPATAGRRTVVPVCAVRVFGVVGGFDVAASAALSGWRRPGRAASPLFFSTQFSPSTGAIHARVGAGFVT
ncbi:MULTISPECIES: hypothetical protein, partial [unclassified Frankia]|uniref:hypothetical protein n=1 Tax=unclassified Frankia TaxID=2632575 RepID=UPI002AD2678C